MGTACLADSVLDLNSPPPSSRTSSSSSSSSPPRSEISNIASATTSVASPATVATSTAKKQSPPGSTATVEADVKQQLAATTFIQADVLNFREVVQKHTGAAEDAQDKMPVTVPARQSGVKNQNSDSQPPLRRHHMSRLHERKQNNLRNLDINRPGGGSPFKRTGCSPRSNSDISPKPHGTLLSSPVTPLTSDASFEQQPLTPTESLRQSFASSLEIKSPVASPSPGTVLERFPFLHQQQFGFHQVTPVVHTHLQRTNHSYVHQPSPHFVYEQHHVQREPELLDLFPVHSAATLKDSQER